jgi:hypothetical protein
VRRVGYLQELNPDARPTKHKKTLQVCETDKNRSAVEVHIKYV